MCSIIVSVRSVLWAVMTIAATLMILVSLFSDRSGNVMMVPDSFTQMDDRKMDGAPEFR